MSSGKGSGQKALPKGSGHGSREPSRGRTPRDRSTPRPRSSLGRFLPRDSSPAPPRGSVPTGSTDPLTQIILDLGGPAEAVPADASSRSRTPALGVDARRAENQLPTGYEPKAESIPLPRSVSREPAPKEKKSQQASPAASEARPNPKTGSTQGQGAA